MAASPHVWIILTKRPQRMLQWVRGLSAPPPHCFWLLASVTGAGSLGRVAPLLELRRLLLGHVIGLSIEPLLEDIAPALQRLHQGLPAQLSWVILGGESVQGGPALFVKQLGSHPVEGGRRLPLRHSHGGDWGEWPEDLRLRQMPQIERRPAGLGVFKGFP